MFLSRLFLRPRSISIAVIDSQFPQARPIACLPLYPDLANDDVLKICKIIKRIVQK